MADEALVELLTTSGGLVAGGGVTAFVVRALFNSFKEQLNDVVRELKALTAKHDERHESIIGQLARLEAKTDAAHRRIDELPKGRRR